MSEKQREQLRTELTRAENKLAETEGVVVVEGSRPMMTELDLSVPESRANVVHTGPPGNRGAGVVVGIWAPQQSPPAPYPSEEEIADRGFAVWPEDTVDEAQQGCSRVDEEPWRLDRPARD